jgi:hypothetical protein
MSRHGPDAFTINGAVIWHRRHRGHGRHPDQHIAIRRIRVWHRSSNVVHVRVGLGAILRTILLKVRLSILKMASTSRVSPSNGAFLKVTLQDITARKCVFAQMTLVGALARVCGTSIIYAWNMAMDHLRRRRWRLRCLRCRYVLLQ